MGKGSTIKLNKDFSIDIPKLIQSRLAALANSGGGKSWLIRRIAEQAAGKVQTIIIDPEGEFSTLREKHDFILCGKDQDVPVEVRSAGKLAEMLLEAKASAVVDLFELHPQERQRFVKIFCDTMVDAPKRLHHPCLVILDEAHDYVPEGKPSEATYAVESLASKGRKRGYSLILVSQRISKISKNALSECNNVLIGRATWQLDRKRAADELGLNNKEEVLSLKKLKPGEFYAVGPAFSSEDLVKIQVGDVATTHAKIGYGKDTKPIPPSEKLRKSLSLLADIPKEAEKEAKTIAEHKTIITQLRRENTQLKKAPNVTDPQEIEKAVKIARREKDIEFMAERDEFIKHINTMFKVLQTIGETALAIKKPDLEARKEKTQKYKKMLSPIIKSQPEDRNVKEILDSGAKVEYVDQEDVVMRGPEQKILDATLWLNDIGVDEPEKTAIAFLAGYKSGGGAFNNPCGSLRTKGFVEYLPGSRMILTDTGRKYAKPSETPLTQEDLHEKVLNILGGPERKLLTPLLESYPEELSNEDLAERSGYGAGGGAFNNPKGRLRTLGLVEYTRPGFIKARDILFPNSI